MANALYTQMKASAARLLKRLGTTVSIETVDGIVLKGFGVLLNSETDDGAGGKRNIKTVYFQGTDKGTPTAGGIVSVNGINWAIVKVDDINPDDKLTIIYKMEVSQ